MALAKHYFPYLIPCNELHRGFILMRVVEAVGASVDMFEGKVKTV
jgi:hypothetical protein